MKNRREEMTEHIHESVPFLEYVTDLELCSMNDYEDYIEIAEKIIWESNDETINRIYTDWYEED